MDNNPNKIICEYCRTRDLTNLNEFNQNEHRKFCKKKYPITPGISNFFKKQIGTTNLKTINPCEYPDRSPSKDEACNTESCESEKETSDIEEIHEKSSNNFGQHYAFLMITFYMVL